MTTPRVSFDFDGCLEVNPALQALAQALMQQGFTVYILTARPDIVYRNYDLLAAADRLGVAQDRILYSFTSSKASLMQEHHILWHFDNDPKEVIALHAHGCYAGLTDLRAWEQLQPAPE